MNPIFKNCKNYDTEHDCCRLASDYEEEPCYQPCLEGPCAYEPKQKTNFECVIANKEYLARLLVKMSLNAEFVPCFYSPDGKEFIMNEERAIQHTIEWLNEPCL